MEIKITKAEDGHILRSFLKESLGLSTATVTLLKWKENGMLLNGTHVTVRAVLHEGDILSLALADTESNQNLVPTPLPLSILYEDEDITVCNKSGDMPTHPSHGHYDDTLANALAYHYADRPYIFRAITRLDRETSGVLLTANNAHAAHKLSFAMQRGDFQKVYLALVEGETESEGRIDFPIRRAEGSVITREVHPAGAPSLTLYRRLHTNGKYSLLAVFPQTGRTHQIRLHLSAIGHPICGDCLYGHEGNGFSRTCLHAVRLTFPHPANGNALSVFAPLAEDLRLLLDRLGFPVPSPSDIP
jgi:23S rRNA pseudouridine1911/1915/1917 synthase